MLWGRCKRTVLDQQQQDFTVAVHQDLLLQNIILKYLKNIETVLYWFNHTLSPGLGGSELTFWNVSTLTVSWTSFSFFLLEP